MTKSLGKKRHVRSAAQQEMDMAMNRSPLPSEPCWRCQARGWCEHRPEGSA
jgi:hypothetical protein